MRSPCRSFNAEPVHAVRETAALSGCFGACRTYGVLLGYAAFGVLLGYATFGVLLGYAAFGVLLGYAAFGVLLRCDTPSECFRERTTLQIQSTQLHHRLCCKPSFVFGVELKGRETRRSFAQLQP